MGLDPAAIHRQRGGLDGAPAAAKDAARFSLGDDTSRRSRRRSASGRLGFFGDWIDALGHGDQLLMGEDAGFLDGHQSVAPDDHAPGAAFGGAILDDEALEARRHDLHAEAAELAIPQRKSPEP